MSDQLPGGWARARIGDMFDCWGGMTPSTSEAKFWGGSMPWISSKDVKGQVVAGGTECVTNYALAENRLRTCPVGTVLVVVRSGVLAHTLPVTVTNCEVVVNQDVKALDSGDSQLNAWAALYLRATQRKILEANRKEGTTVQSIRVPELLDHELSVAPLAEQRRVVAKVEALLEQVRHANDRLDRVPLILERFRQAVLAAACSGQLTEDWREPAQVEPAKKASGTERTFSPHREVQDLPAGWRWQTLRSLVGPKDVFCYGVVQPGHDDPNGVPLIRAGDLHDLEAALPNLRRIPIEIDNAFRRSRVVGGEVLVTVVGANIGTVALVPSAAVGFNIARAVAKVPVSGAKPEFVLLWLRTATAYRWMVGEAREVARPTLNLEQLGEIPVPVPPPEEQAEIVGRVDDLFALATAIEQRVERAATCARSLPQAILSKAFAGELVPTEAELARAEGREYETAEVLLERVRRGLSAATSDAACRRRKVRRVRT